MSSGIGMMRYVLNEVLSITAQEFRPCFLQSVVQVQFLNEVLSITAQELGSPNHYQGRNGPQ